MIFYSYQSSASVFELKETSARFKLTMNKDGLVYNSESFHKIFKSKKCNQNQLSNFSREFIRMIPERSEKEGLSFYINGDKTLIKYGGTAASRILSMDATILVLELQVSKTCRI